MSLLTGCAAPAPTPPETTPVYSAQLNPKANPIPVEGHSLKDPEPKRVSSAEPEPSTQPEPGAQPEAAEKTDEKQKPVTAESAVEAPDAKKASPPPEAPPKSAP